MTVEEIIALLTEHPLPWTHNLDEEDEGQQVEVRDANGTMMFALGPAYKQKYAGGMAGLKLMVYALEVVYGAGEQAEAEDDIE